MNRRKLSIRQKINVAIFIEATLIAAISVFIFLTFKTVLSKLRFIEEFDDINISFLEMRKAEKNYFLYHDPDALTEAYHKGSIAYRTLKRSQEKLTSVLGKDTYNSLIQTLDKYLATIQNIKKPAASPEFASYLRDLGHNLTQLSTHLIKSEHRKINEIIHQSTVMLILSILGIFFSQLFRWHYFSTLLAKKLAKMESLTHTVAKGQFHEVAVQESEPEDEIGLVINAIAKMAQELEKREEQLLQAKKLASLGVLISGVAHELGNPLNNISMLAEGYLSYFDSLSDEEKKQFMKDIQIQTERIRKIVRNLLDFARQKKPEFKVCNPKEIVEKSISLVENQLRVSKIRLHKTFAPKLPSIYVDENQIQQVLINLFTNAIHAMSGGGDLFVDVYSPELKDKVVIRVKDTGSGIKPEILPHIFDPFFTTKGTKGTGLGLSVSYGIIKQHNGKISVETEVGKGTTFTIELPAYQENKEGANG